MRLKTFKTRTLMLTATLAAVYAVLRIIPTFPMIGVPGARFSSSDFVASLYGILLGPYTSIACIVVGTFIGYFAGRPPVFYGLDFTPAALNSLIVSLLIRRLRLHALTLYLLLMILFAAHPYTLLTVNVPASTGLGFPFPFFWLHLVGLIILATPVGSYAARNLFNRRVGYAALSFSLISLVGTLAQHLTGNILYASIILPLLSESARVNAWTIIFWLYPFERLVIVVASTIIGVPVVRALAFRLRLDQE
ncbi:MAG: hypothetical protein QXI59_01110 [Candidatus Bathyarchaeia archaeon]|nr:hypothetical protein [Candidatus Bathyarchaeota archaeon]